MYATSSAARPVPTFCTAFSHAFVLSFRPTAASTARRGTTRGVYVVRGSIAQHRVEEAGQTAGQREDGDLFPPARGDAGRPPPPGGRARIAQAQDRHGRLDERSAHPAVPGFGDPAAAPSPRPSP